MSRWPVFRTGPEIAGGIRFADIFWSTLTGLVLLPVAAFVLGWLGSLVLPAASAGDPSLPVTILALVAFSGLVAWIAAPVALGCGWLACRHGWAGWGTASVVGYALAAIILLLIGAGDRSVERLADDLGVIAILSLVGAAYGLACWCALRFFRPDLFARA